MCFCHDFTLLTPLIRCNFLICHFLSKCFDLCPDLLCVNFSVNFREILGSFYYTFLDHSDYPYSPFFSRFFLVTNFSYFTKYFDLCPNTFACIRVKDAYCIDKSFVMARSGGGILCSLCLFFMGQFVKIQFIF